MGDDLLDFFERKHPRAARRIEKLIHSGEKIRANDEIQKRSDALTTARALALAFLPRKRTKEKQVSRTIRLGLQRFVSITYTTGGKELPFGADRFVLAGIIHLAIAAGSPTVYFDSTNELLKLFKLPGAGVEYERLRNRLVRIANLFITIRYGKSEQDILDGSQGENHRMIAKYDLPRRDEMAGGKEPKKPRYATIAGEIWEHIKIRQHHLTIPLDFLHPFCDKPAAWDLCVLLYHRCMSARSESVLDHYALMNMFRDGKERDKDVIRRLQGYLEEIKTATDGRLKADLEEYKPQHPSPWKKYWRLRVKPMEQPVLWSGKKS